MLNLTTLPASDNLALFHVARLKDEDDRNTFMLKMYRIKAQDCATLERMITFTGYVAERIFCNTEKADSQMLSKRRDDAIDHLAFVCANKHVANYDCERLCAMLINYVTSLQMSLIDSNTNNEKLIEACDKRVDELQEERDHLKSALQTANRHIDMLLWVVDKLNSVRARVEDIEDHIADAQCVADGLSKEFKYVDAMNIDGARAFSAALANNINDND